MAQPTVARVASSALESPIVLPLPPRPAVGLQIAAPLIAGFH